MQASFRAIPVALVCLALAAPSRGDAVAPSDPPPRTTAWQDAGPRPDAGDRILVDARAPLQRARNLGEAECALRAPAPCRPTVRPTAETDFTLDVDGRGTRALRKSWHATTECIDAPGAVPWLVRLPAPKPRRLYMRWNMRLARTATGGGLGPVGAFQVANAVCGNAGRKVWLTLRDVPDQGPRGRMDYIWPGPAPVTPTVSFATGNARPNRGLSFDPQRHVGETITHVLYLQAESRDEADDGVVRVWVNGRLLMEHTGLDIGPQGFDRFQFPSTFRAPAGDQTEYFWDVVAWEPAP